jgi:hypothetical protein
MSGYRPFKPAEPIEVVRDKSRSVRLEIPPLHQAIWQDALTADDRASKGVDLLS